MDGPCASTFSLMLLDKLRLAMPINVNRGGGKGGSGGVGGTGGTEEGPRLAILNVYGGKGGNGGPGGCTGGSGGLEHIHVSGGRGGAGGRGEWGGEGGAGEGPVVFLNSGGTLNINNATNELYVKCHPCRIPISHIFGGSYRPSKTITCEHCETNGTGRNIILSFDGTSNQYGNKNTNVIELYARIIKDDNQLTYYNSGIGTYARPSWRSLKYWKQVIDNHIDLAIAWNFDRAVLAGYRWLSDHYRPGDRIFLFGFSRGAYQVRALAAMIDKVGLILPGNEEQIPFAYELYADLKTHSNKGYDGETSARFFKKTFCRPNVRIHFLGAWDSVSSVGIVRGKNLPGTYSFDENICYFRHALALDERRVKFLPEYICGGKSHPEELDGGATARVKEVWFAGCHSDIGGGVGINDKLDNAAVPVLWMGNEAQHAGLKLEASPVEWKWEQLETSQPTESLTWVWRLFELLPIKHLSYVDTMSEIRHPHRSEGRVIKPGQKIHASVAFIKNYQPKAILPPEAKGWHRILGKGRTDELSWTEDLQDIVEMDLFDLSKTPALVEAAISDRTSFSKLRFLSKTREGAASIAKADPELNLFTVILNSKQRELVLREHSAQILLNLAGYETVRRALTWSRSIDALAVAAAEGLSSFELRTQVFQALSLLCDDGMRHFKYKSIDDLRRLIGRLDDIINHIPDNALEKSSAILAFGEFNYILYLGHRTGIEDGVSTFEHYWRRRLSAASSQPPSTSLRYLEKSVAIYRKGLTTQSYLFRCEYLDRLVTCLQARSVEIEVGHGDLDKAIALLREVPATQNTIKQELSCTNLADTLTARFTRSKDSQDIHAAIQLYRDILEKYPAPNPNRSMTHNNLAGALYEQGMQQKDSEVLDECIRLYREALPDIAPSGLIRARSLTNLAGAIQKRFDGLEGVDEVIMLYKEAAALCLPMDLGTALDNLCNSVCQKYRSDARLPVIREATTNFNHFLVLRNESKSLTGVSLEMYRLVGEGLGREPDRRVGRNGNLVDTSSKVRFRSEPANKYGFRIRNESTDDLFPYLLYFDPDEYTVNCWYTPGMHHYPPLKRAGGIVAVGMGDGGLPFEFTLPEDESSSSGFLKLLVSTEYLDVELIQQQMSPFDSRFEGTVRLGMIQEKLSQAKWDALVVVLTMTSEVTV
ncbi:hypothetical protein DFH09DRAFT_217728 [Mycena vulgaris]|nr:hypothetical protein DFH09DRAFT_217728 [Mycena vulgaris]